MLTNFVKTDTLTDPKDQLIQFEYKYNITDTTASDTSAKKEETITIQLYDNSDKKVTLDNFNSKTTDYKFKIIKTDSTGATTEEDIRYNSTITDLKEQLKSACEVYAKKQESETIKKKVEEIQESLKKQLDSLKGNLEEI